MFLEVFLGVSPAPLTLAAVGLFAVRGTLLPSLTRAFRYFLNFILKS
jgi:hypothetical protein